MFYVPCPKGFVSQFLSEINVTPHDIAPRLLPLSTDSASMRMKKKKKKINHPLEKIEISHRNVIFI